MDKTSVTFDQYVRFREDGFLIVRGLLAADEVRDLLDHVDELLTERADLLRVHMLHREPSSTSAICSILASSTWWPGSSAQTC